MTKLNHTLFAGALLAGVAAIPSAASADREIGRATGFDVRLASTTYDLAETRVYEDGIARLRYNDQDYPGAEDGVVKFSPDGRRAVYAVMTSGVINEGTPMEAYPPNKMQCSLSALQLGVGADGAFTITRPASAPYDVFATNNNGNEWRNCNKPAIYVINGGQNIALEYNYQPAGTSDTKRYLKVFTWDLEPVSLNGEVGGQVVVMAKDHDDCDMHQGGNFPGDVHYDVGGRTRIVKWAGCNGDGTDDGWLNETEVSCTGGGAAAVCTATRVFDISLAREEERSRGRCSVGGADRTFATCCWTEGNNQPQREGVWCAGVDIQLNGENGEDAQSRLLWKERLERETIAEVNGQPRDYYAMRMNQTRLQEMLPDGSLSPTSQILVTWGRNRGGNNNDKKGGRSDMTIGAVLETTRTGYTYVMDKTVLNPLLLGYDNTHVAVTDAVYGKGSSVMPGMSMVVGSHTGGSYGENAELRTIMYDTVRKEFVNLGQHDLDRSWDRHMYSNYLGNNPGFQGRNFMHCDLVRNPYADMSGNYVTYFQACALTGKAAQHTDAAIKLSAFVTLFPVAFTEDPPPVGGGWDEDEIPGDDGGGGDDGPGDSVGGCSTGSGSSTLLLGLALVGLVIIRRRK